MASEDKIILNPADLALPDRYKLLIGTVVPRPIAWVSTLSDDGKANLAPFSYFNAVCTAPPTVMFCPNVRGETGEKKDTLRNIEANGEYVINLVSEDICEKMNQTAADYPYGVSEFEAAQLTALPSEVVKPPRVAESPINLECTLQQIVPIGTGARGSGFIVIGTIVRFHIRKDVYDNGKIDVAALKPVARLAGSSYCPVREVFDLPRPVV